MGNKKSKNDQKTDQNNPFDTNKKDWKIVVRIFKKKPFFPLISLFLLDISFFGIVIWRWSSG